MRLIITARIYLHPSPCFRSTIFSLRIGFSRTRPVIRRPSSRRVKLHPPFRLFSRRPGEAPPVPVYIYIARIYLAFYHQVRTFYTHPFLAS
jgi:hypothetical protein